MRNLIPIGKKGDLGFLGEFELDRIFEDFFKRSFPVKIFSKDIVPLIDVYEKDNRVIVKAELAGMKPEEVDISVDGNLLTISGEKKQENEVKEKDYYRLERSYGSFQRAVELPTGIKADQAKASYKNGILQIELPKSEDSRKKKIKIEVR